MLNTIRIKDETSFNFSQSEPHFFTLDFPSEFITPREIIRRLNSEINRAMQHPDVNAKLVTAGLNVANESPEWFEKFIRTEYAKYGKLVKDIGLKPK